MLEDLERRLADAATAYIAATEERSRPEAARHLCAVLEFVSDARLKTEESWSQHAWVDGVLSDSIESIEPRSLLVRGKLIWVDGNEWWLEPFEATLDLGTDRQRLMYELRIGDSERGLRAVPYGSFQRREVVVTEWVFRLRSE
jgi:hypothetical protein